VNLAPQGAKPQLWEVQSYVGSHSPK
jgi:hypothetical protein